MFPWDAGRSKDWYDADEPENGGNGCLIQRWYDVFLIPFEIIFAIIYMGVVMPLMILVVLIYKTIKGED